IKPRDDCADSFLADGIGRNISRKSVVKLSNREQLLDFLREVRTHIVRRSLNFSDQFGAAVDNGNQIFKVATRREIILATARKSFDLRSTEIYRRDQSNLQPLFQFTFFSVVHCRSIPRVRKSEDLRVKRHHIECRRLLTPPEKRGPLSFVFLKPTLSH